MSFGKLFRRLAPGVVALSLAGPLVLATPAGAAVDPSAPVWYEVDVTGKAVTSNVTRFDEVLGSCYAPQGGITCNVRAERSATRTIGLAFGMSFAGVAASLGISKARTETIGSSCQLKTRPPTYPRVNGYANGQSIRYTIRQRTYEYGRLTQTKTSVQYAFNPLGISCGLAS